MRADRGWHIVPMLAAALVSGTGIPPASAHHSVAMFDGRRVVMITGTVTGFRWINPHASIQLDANGGDEPGGPWTVEMQAPATLMADGWSRESLAIGDRITLFANPLRDGVASSAARRGLYVGVIFPGGKSLGQVEIR